MSAHCDVCAADLVIDRDGNFLCEVCELKTSLAKKDAEIESLKQKLLESQAREMRLRNSLEFYGSEENWLDPIGCLDGGGGKPWTIAEKALNHPAPPIADVLDKVIKLLDSNEHDIGCSEYEVSCSCFDKKAGESLAALQSLRGEKNV